MSDVIDAHDHCSNHFDSVKSSDTCGCFSCISIFAPEEITTWVDDGQTAVCPECEIDSVIGSDSGFEITEVFLAEMKTHWFDTIHE